MHLTAFNSTRLLHFVFERVFGEMKLNQSGTQKSRPWPWPQAKRTKLHSDLAQKGAFDSSGFSTEGAVISTSEVSYRSAGSDT